MAAATEVVAVGVDVEEVVEAASEEAVVGVRIREVVFAT